MADFFSNFWAFNVNAFYEVLYFVINNIFVLIAIVGIVGCFIWEEIDNHSTDIVDERNII